MILWEGSSRLDGMPIVAIATGLRSRSTNRKTGAMVQTYILRQDTDPVSAHREGLDVSICGACPLRGNVKRGIGRSCYVNLGHGPLAVYRAYKRGSYPLYGGPSTFRGRKVRLGTYGDPAAVPIGVWDSVLSEAIGWTGYSHQWQAPKHREVLRYCQASVDPWTKKDPPKGAGTFRVLPMLGTPAPNETLCPSLQGVNCADCLLCDGTGAAIAIHAHGNGKEHVP